MELEFIDISQHGEEKRTSGDRNYVSGSVVHADGSAVRNQYRKGRTTASARAVSARNRVREGQFQRVGNGTRKERVQSVRRTPEEIERRRQMILQKRKRKRQRRIVKGIILLCETAFIILLCLLLYQFIRSLQVSPKDKEINMPGEKEVVRMIEENKSQKPLMTEDFLTVNPYSRPGEKLEDVNNIFVHYTANRGTSAAQNRSYFENLGITGETSASAHFIIGYDGEIIQCVPLNEIAYAVAGRNYDSVSIECCYQDADGEFTYATYQSLIRLSAWLLNEYKLSPEDMRRHYDEGGKKCPIYFVEHEGAWEQFLQDLSDYILKEEEPVV